MLSGVSLKLSFFKTNVALATLFLISTSIALCQTPEKELPVIQAKAKPGLIKIRNSIVYGDSTYGRVGSGALVFDDAYAYVATPNGLFKTAQPITSDSSFELLGFQNKAIFDLLVHNNKLFVLKHSQAVLSNQPTEHSVLKSEDRGATFVPADNGLKYCRSDGYCLFLEATQALSKNNLIFFNAGIGVQVSSNEAASWIPLTGGLVWAGCGQSVFEIVNTRLFTGGECPLDVAYLRGISLRPDLLAVLPPEQQPSPIVVPSLDNRNVMIIKHKPNSPDIYAGNEGGLLKSSDNGQSFRYVIKYSGSRYPYINKILTYSKSPNVIVIGGFDKLLNQPFLAYSKDNGETWFEISSKIQSLIGGTSFPLTNNVLFISEDPQGRVLVGVTHPRTKNLFIIQLRVDVAALR
jgi:hypothetical protein